MKVDKFDWQKLNGKTLKIFVGEDVETIYNGVTKTTCVLGWEEKTGISYLLHTEQVYTVLDENKKFVSYTEEVVEIE